MRHHKKGRKFSRSAAHRDALLMNLAGNLIEHGRIKTTLAKAKELRPFVEPLVTRAGTDTVHNRRTITQTLRMSDRQSKIKASTKDERVPTIVQKLFSDVGPRFVDRPGGYTRILKLGPRPGDNAEMAYIEWVDYVPEAKPQTHDHDHAHAHDHSHEPAAAGA